MGVTEIKQNRMSIGEWGQGRRVYNVEYRVTLETNNEGPAHILRDPKVPQLYATTYGYGTAYDQGAICTSISVPRRELGGKSKRQWIFTAEYTFDIKNDPDYIPVTIVPFFIRGSEPVENAVFQGWWNCDKDMNFTKSTVVDPSLSWLVPGEAWQGSLTDNRPPTVGPVSNSALTPVVPGVERRKSTLGMRVSWVKRTAYNFDSWINTTNDSAYTLTAYDKVPTEHEPSPQKLIYQRTFLQSTLLLADVQTEMFKIYDRLHYRYTLEFHASLFQHVHFQFDRGVEKCMVPEHEHHRDSDGKIIDTEVVPQKGRPPTGRIIGSDDMPVKDPVAMDGMGQELYTRANRDGSSASNPDPIFLAWQLYPQSPFNQLPIGDTS